MLAVLLTDAASFARIDLIDLATGKPRRARSASAIPSACSSAWSWPTATRAWCWSAATPAPAAARPSITTSQGKAAGILGPVDEVGVVRDKGGQRVLIAITHASGRDADTYKVTRHAIARPGPGRQAEQLHPDQGAAICAARR